MHLPTARDEDLHAAFRAALRAFAYPGRRQRGSARLVVAAVFGEPLDAAGTPPIVVDGARCAAAIAAARRGSEEAPEDGATIVVLPSQDVRPTRVRLRGPGVDGAFETSLPLDARVLAARDEACRHYPLGVDLLLAEGEWTLVGLPRTTHVEVLD